VTLWPWLILIAAYGACVGSFLNVVILRLPAGKSLVHPPSHDPATGERLKWWENIPIVSWLALRGRSRYTGERISVQYPLVEAFTMLSFAGLFAA
jgi:leader peptidase (prepilin peptidase) / N-methyltransferase